MWRHGFPWVCFPWVCWLPADVQCKLLFHMLFQSDCSSLLSRGVVCSVTVPLVPWGPLRLSAWAIFCFSDLMNPMDVSLNQVVDSLLCHLYWAYPAWFYNYFYYLWNVMQFYISHLVLFLNIYDIWFTSPASQNFQDWARPKAEAWTLVSPTWATETQVLEPVPAVSRVHGAHIQGTHPQVGCVRLQLWRCVLTQTWAAVPIPCFSADFFPTFLFQENL